MVGKHKSLYKLFRIQVPVPVPVGLRAMGEVPDERVAMALQQSLPEVWVQTVVAVVEVAVVRYVRPSVAPIVGPDRLV